MWAAHVAQIAGLPTAHALLGLDKTHPLRREIPREAWVSVVSGSADILRVVVGGTSIAACVARIPGFEAAALTRTHPIWRLAAQREPGETQFRRLLANFPIVEIQDLDWIHREWMGLVVDRDDDIDGFQLLVDWRAFRSLDGLFVLLRVLEHAQRAGERDQARHLEVAVEAAARAFSGAMGLRGTGADHWTWCVQHLLAGPWWPQVPTRQELEYAREQLLVERGSKRGSSQGREASRRRAQAELMRAFVNRRRHTPLFRFIPAEPRWRWLVANRDAIAVHIARAVAPIFEPHLAFEPEPALRMPAALFNARSPPPIAQSAVPFGSSPYDLIPIVVVTNASDSGALLPNT